MLFVPASLSEQAFSEREGGETVQEPCFSRLTGTSIRPLERTMGSTLRSLTRWSQAPAKGVQTASKSWVNVPRGLAARATTPLLPDDYLKMLNPLWSARELRGLIVDVHPETADSATVAIKPGWGFSAKYRPGEYVGIGLRIDGRWHWRSYSLTSVPRRDNKNITITVKATPEGFLSTHLVNGVKPGTIVRLAAPKGDFALPDPPPAKVLFITAGSGITPVMAMLRTLKSRGQQVDIAHIHTAPSADAVIFLDELRELESTQSGYRLHLQLTKTQGKVDFDTIADIVADWQDRPAWVCGPPALLDTVEGVWKSAGRSDLLHTERFTIAATDKGGEGGTVTFAISDKSVEIDGATSLLEAGEKVGIQMPFGCRMGICQTCVLPLESGHVRDFRSGIEHREGDRIQTCISTASGDCTLKI
jgi:stearoyl-CoA 9-desaturase NADPH oxidoreductase